MVLLSDIAQKQCQRCKKHFDVLEPGIICPQCQSFLSKIEYKKETKKQYLSKKKNYII